MDRFQIAYKKRMKETGEWGLHRGDRTEQSRRYRKRYPLRARAGLAVQHALETGRLRRPKWCQKCKKRPVAVAHHEDYKAKLDVDWLCWKCHNELRKPERG